MRLPELERAPLVDISMLMPGDKRRVVMDCHAPCVIVLRGQVEENYIEARDVYEIRLGNADR